MSSSSRSNASLFERMCVSAKSLVGDGATRDRAEFQADKELVVELIRKERKRVAQQCEKPYNTFLNEIKKVSLRSRADVNRAGVDAALEQLQRALAAQSSRCAQKAALAKDIRAGDYAPGESAAFIDDASVDATDVLYVSSSDDDLSESEYEEEASSSSSLSSGEDDAVLDTGSCSSSSGSDDDDDVEESPGKRRRIEVSDDDE